MSVDLYTSSGSCQHVGKTEHLGLGHLDWHYSTALANSALHIRGIHQTSPIPKE